MATKVVPLAELRPDPTRAPTAEQVVILAEHLRHGRTRTTAAQLAGVEPAVLARWLHRGEGDAPGGACHALLEAVLAAEAEARARVGDARFRAAIEPGATKAAAEWQTARGEDNWGPEGAPICGAQTKNRGSRCLRRPAPGMSRCKQHGGARGVGRPIKSGSQSRLVDRYPTLGEIWKGLLDRPENERAAEQLALIEALQDEILALEPAEGGHTCGNCGAPVPCIAADAEADLSRAFGVTERVIRAASEKAKRDALAAKAQTEDAIAAAINTTLAVLRPFMSPAASMAAARELRRMPVLARLRIGAIAPRNMTDLAE